MPYYAKFKPRPSFRAPAYARRSFRPSASYLRAPRSTFRSTTFRATSFRRRTGVRRYQRGRSHHRSHHRSYHKRGSKSIQSAYNTVIATSTICRLKYAETFSPAITAGVPYWYFFNLNSPFDPNRTGVGHQPYGFDTLATIYNRYRVYKVSYSVEVLSTGGFTFQVTALNGAFTPTTPDAGSEQPGTVVKKVSG